MWDYVNRISDIINELSLKDRNELSGCLDFIENKIKVEDTPVVFITNINSNVIMRLALMTAGKVFYVVPTTMTSSEIISCLTEIVNPVVITDNIENIKCNIKFAKIYEYDIVCNFYSGDFSLSSYKIEQSFKMILYSNSLNTISTDQHIFIAIFDNLIETLKKENLLNKALHYACDFKDDFFIFYLVLLYSNKNIVSFNISSDLLYSNTINKKNKTANNSRVLYISYQAYRDIWKEVLSSTLQNKLLFKWFFNKWLGRIIIYLIIRKFERYFKPFKNIIVIGLITDPILAEVSEKLRHSLVYNTYGEQSSLMFFGISKQPGSICLSPSLTTLSMSLKDNRKIYSILSDKENISSSTETSQLVMTIRGSNFLKSITTKDLFTVKNGFAKFLGYAFSNGVCPAYVESIFNSFPFIKDSALVWWKNKYILLLDIDEAMLDANRINYLFFNKIMKGQVKKVNQELLPEAIQISTFGQIPSMVLKYNRWGLLDKEFLYKVELFNQ